MKKLLVLPFTLLAFVFGKFTWTAPRWLQAIFNIIRANAKASIGLLVLACAGYGGYLYYDSLPKPVMVKAHFYDIHTTPNYANATPSNIEILFEYDFSQLKEDQERPEGVPSVARIDLVGKEVPSGITLSPAKKGTWSWTGDRSLRFVPETDWPAGTEYTVTFDSNIFSEETVLSQSSYSVTTPSMTANFSNIEFYQDPQDISVRRVVSTLSFSHPVDNASLEKALKMGMRPSGDNIDVPLKPYGFSITYDKQYREAYIQSEPVSLPEKSNYMTVTLPEGVKTLLGGQSIQNEIETKILIPDVYSFLKVGSNAQIVRNEKDEPEQILMLDFTDDISEEEVLSKLNVYLLPGNGERNGRNYWRSPREVKANVLANSKKLDLTLIPNERGFSKLFNFKFDAPENRSIYIKIDKGFTSVNKFVHASFYDNVVYTPRYPKEANIVGEGSVLTYTGNHKLNIQTRGVPGVKYKIGKLLEGQLYHLISQTSGDISNPNFDSWYFREENIAEFDEQIVPLNQAHPKQANFSSLDLSQYLPREKNRFGLFFVNVAGYDFKTKSEIYEAQDKRLILVTDLGVIVKNNADSSHDLFVQSIATGRPVANATVELLGKNGVPIFSGATNSQGRVSIPATDGLYQEKQPTVYIVKSAGDLSFIPFDRYSRQINLSKFDIGGVSSTAYNQEALNAFLFSDRGIYRPGETVNVGMIVKNFDLSNVENIPLELSIRGPRHNEAKVSKFTLPKMGFADFQYPTEQTSDTGGYQATLYLVRNGRRSRQIGSTNFKVEEFQPDTMKIQSQLVDVVDKGWNTQETIKAKVTLNNLFGTPAQDRKMSGRLKIQPHNFKFKTYQDYTFTDPYFNKDDKPLSLNTSLGDERTDADGAAEFDLDLSKFKQGTYRLSFTAEGFDQAGGRSVIASNSALISPLETIVGFKADGDLSYINADSDRSIEFIAIDKALKKKAVSDLTIKLKEIQSISTLVRQQNGTYKYQTVRKEQEVSSEALSLEETGYQYTVDTKTPGEFSLEIYDADARKLSSVSYSVVGFANLSGKIDKNAELQVKLNKKDYKAGENIELSIKAPYHGAGLITIESDRVHNHVWFKTSQESTVQNIRIPQYLEGTGYVNVAFVRDVSSKEIYTSPLSYAVMPFSIDKSKRRVNVSIETKQIVRPGKPMDIAFSTSKPSRIAVFAIDEGILQVAKYKTPDPLGHFLQKRALNVNTLQILDLILPDFDIVKELSASGGGRARREALAKNLNPFARKVDKPAVFWSGIYDASQTTQNVTFNVPDTFSGELRVMAVAVSDEAVGASHTSAIVRGPFVISPNVLTQTAPGDEFLVTVGVANIIDGSGKGADVALSVQASEHLEIVGQSQTNLKIDEGNEGKFTFKVKAKNVLGAAELRFTAKHKNEDATRTASLSVRPATTYYTSFDTGYDKDGSITLDNLRSIYPDLAEQSVAASASPLVIVDGLQAYLKTFPHGCTEQVVSKVFPLVGLITHPAYGAHVGEVREHFDHLITRLRERQMGDGGFSFWPGHSVSSTYPSIYAMHFLLEASEQGYPVPSDMMQRGKDYLNNYAVSQDRSMRALRNRANAIYILTRMGEVTTNHLVDLEDSLLKDYKGQWESDITSVYMAATYKMLQKDEEASRLIDGYKLNGKHKDLSDFRSVLTLDAQYIYLLTKHFENKAQKIDGSKILLLTEQIFQGRYNTISSAYSILALGAYSKLVLAGDFNENIAFKGLSAADQEKVLNASLAPFLKASYEADVAKVKVEGKESLFYLNVQSGFDTSAPEKAIREGIEVYRTFEDEDGNDVTTFEQGKELTVKLKVRALDGKSLTNIAVIDLLPGGFEAIRSSVSRTAVGWRADYVDVREDRVVYYGNFNSTLRELTYKVKLTASGEFVIPPSHAESMYDRSIRAISEAGAFTVTPSQ